MRVCAPEICVGHGHPPVPFRNPSCPQAPDPARPRPRNHVLLRFIQHSGRTSENRPLLFDEHADLARGLLGRAGASGGIPDGPVYRREQACLVPGGQLSYISTNVVQRTARWQRQRQT